MFSAKFLVLSRFSHFEGTFQAIFGPEQIKFKSPDFQGSTGNPECSKIEDSNNNINWNIIENKISFIT